ncbi:MAG: pyridoxamine 5'-phosphate oxidase [Acidimicrobiia bacterium]|nr:pyridoxamine 5'-phosphate oxidase [Acidimicrobiia bacterium]
MSACPDLDVLRSELQERGLRRAELADDPFEQFRRWFDFATEVGLHEPEAMIVSSVGDDGVPSSRHVLLRGLDHGFVFFTNYASHKGRELAARPVAAICFPWNLLARQVRVEGTVERVTPAESDEYFATRPRGSQIGAWASDQSEVLDGRASLEARWAAAETRFAGTDVPRPPHWGGFRVFPRRVEFWQGRPSRLHDRFRYTTDRTVGTEWTIDRLSP